MHVDDVSGNISVAVGTGRAALLAAVATAWGGRLDCLVNNAGTNVRKTVLDATEEEYSMIMVQPSSCFYSAA